MENVLRDSDLQFFYEILCKSCKNEYVGLDIKSSKLKSFLKAHNVILDYENEIIRHQDPNKIMFEVKTTDTGRRKPIVPSFFHHIRNAFAHLNINVDGDNYIIMDEDYFDEKNSGKKHLTMYGIINKELFVELVKEIEATKK